MERRLGIDRRILAVYAQLSSSSCSDLGFCGTGTLAGGRFLICDYPRKSAAS
jgi:hypothetical protein